MKVSPPVSFTTAIAAQAQNTIQPQPSSGPSKGVKIQFFEQLRNAARTQGANLTITTPSAQGAGEDNSHNLREVPNPSSSGQRNSPLGSFVDITV